MPNQEVRRSSGFLWLMMSMFLLDEWTAGQRDEESCWQWAETRGKKRKRTGPNLDGEEGRQESDKEAKSVSEIRVRCTSSLLSLEPLDRACPDYQFDLPEALFQICSVSIPPPPV